MRPHLQKMIIVIIMIIIIIIIMITITKRGQGESEEIKKVAFRNMEKGGPRDTKNTKNVDNLEKR